MVFRWGFTVSVIQLITMLQTTVTVKLEKKNNKKTESLSPIYLQIYKPVCIPTLCESCVTELQLGPKAEIHDSYWTCSRNQHRVFLPTQENM